MPPLYPRSLAPVLQRAAAQFPAVVVTGPRQSGKTTLVKSLFASSHGYIDLDNPQMRRLAFDDAALFLERHPPPLVVDEIQRAPELLSHLKVLIDERRSRKGQFILTGSQQFALMRGVTESLAGRACILSLLPMSWAERRRGAEIGSALLGRSARSPTATGVMTHRDKMQGDRRPLGALDLARGIVRGSFPEIVADARLDRELWYSSYVQTYLERDVRSLREIGNLGEFQAFLHAAAARNGQLISLSELSRDLGLAVNTIKAWVAVLEASHQVFILRPYHRNRGKRLVKTPKLYFIDTGLLCHLIGLQDAEHALQGPAAGSLFETAVLGEILRTFANRGRPASVYFWRTERGEEVDFIVEDGASLIPIEVKLTKSPNRAMAQGLESFMGLFAQEAPRAWLVCLTQDAVALTASATAVPFLFCSGK